MPGSCFAGQYDFSRRPTELCSSIDIVPTILAAAGADAPHSFPGLNLLPEMKSGEKIDRNVLYGESFAHDIADIDQPHASLLYRWVIRGDHKLLLTYDGAPGKMKYPPQDGEPKLFNLATDPGENLNLAGKKPAIVSELSQLLDRWYIPTGRTAGLPKRKRHRRQTRKSANEHLSLIRRSHSGGKQTRSRVSFLISPSASCHRQQAVTNHRHDLHLKHQIKTSC